MGGLEAVNGDSVLPAIDVHHEMLVSAFDHLEWSKTWVADDKVLLMMPLY